MPAKPTNFDYAFYKQNKPNDLKEDPKTQVNMTFLYDHYTDYPKLDKHSTINKVMYDRVNVIRQMTAGIKKTRDSINLAYKNAKSPKQGAFKGILYEYLELLRKAERDQQTWIKNERRPATPSI